VRREKVKRINVSIMASASVNSFRKIMDAGNARDDLPFILSTSSTVIVVVFSRVSALPLATLHCRRFWCYRLCSRCPLLLCL